MGQPLPHAVYGATALVAIVHSSFVDQRISIGVFAVRPIRPVNDPSSPAKTAGLHVYPSVTHEGRIARLAG